MARIRGSNEPERSRVRTKDLDRFIRDLQATLLDRGRKVSVSDQAQILGAFLNS